MTAATTSPAATEAGRDGAAWLHSAGFDLAFFLAPVGLGLAYYAFTLAFPGWWFAVSGAYFVVLAYGHYSLTFTFYFDREHRPYYTANALRYYVVPGLFAATVLVGYAVLPWLFFAIDYILTQHHCTKQSTGLCGLYRHRAKAFSSRSQWWENGAVYLACTVLVAHGFVKYGLLADIGVVVGSNAAWYGALSTGAFALTGAWCAGVLIVMLRRAAIDGWTTHAPRIWFWLTSVAMYTPVLYVSAGSTQTAALEGLRTVIIIGLTQHWLQYYGIVYLHGRNKYTRPEHGDQAWAGWARNLPRLVAYAIAVGALIGVFKAAHLRFDTVWGRLAFGVVLAVGWVHYWLDRQIWAFKDAHNRETILPYLK